MNNSIRVRLKEENHSNSQKNFSEIHKKIKRKMLSSMAHFARVLCFIWRFTEKCFGFDVEKEITD